MATRLAFCLVLLLACPLRADDAKAPPLTDLESARVQALNYEVQHVNALYELAKAAQDKADHAKADAQAHMAALKTQLEAARPGWTWHPEDGSWTRATPAPSAK